MSICNSCGGVIGRDCFNPSECAWISESMAQQAAQQNNAQDEQIRSLELRCAELEQELENYRPVAEAKGATKAISQRDAALAQIAALSARVAELEANLAEATKKQPINTSLRLFDLVRYSRADLHQDGLITDEEYGNLCAGPMAMSPKGGSPSRQRLEDYDELRAQLSEARKDRQRLDWLETQQGHALVSDDFGHWSVAGCGFQSVPENPPDDVQTSFFIQKEEWQTSTRAAIDAAMPLPETKEGK